MIRLVLETGAGTPGANGYTSIAFVTQYLQERSRETENKWDEVDDSLCEGAIISATDYIDKRWGPSVRGTALRPVIEGRVAKGTLVLTSNALASSTFTLGSVVYRMVTALALENDVLIGADATETVENLRLAIIGGEGRGIVYHEDTRLNMQATAAVDEDDDQQLNVSAFIAGENGNGIALAKTIAGSTVSGATLASGIDTGPQPLIFPKLNLFTPRGEPVVGVPLKVKQCTAEYAVRALGAALTIDPTLSSTGALIKSLRERVGPIEEETVYVDGGQPQVWKSYPAADALLADYVLSGGRTYR